MRVSESVDPHIDYNLSFAEWEAATAANLDLWKWESGGFSNYFKAKVVAWYGLHNLVELHKQDALSKSIKGAKGKNK